MSKEVKMEKTGLQKKNGSSGNELMLEIAELLEILPVITGRYKSNWRLFNIKDSFDDDSPIKVELSFSPDKAVKDFNIKMIARSNTGNVCVLENRSVVAILSKKGESIQIILFDTGGSETSSIFISFTGENKQGCGEFRLAKTPV